MKQIIVLAAFIGLGIFISSVVFGFTSDVEKLQKSAEGAVNQVSQQVSEYVGTKTPSASTE